MKDNLSGVLSNNNVKVEHRTANFDENSSPTNPRHN